MRKNLIVLSNGGFTFNDRVRTDAGSLTNGNLASNNRVRTNGDVFPNFCTIFNDGSFMDVTH
jgi:hypothetical protein